MTENFFKKETWDDAEWQIYLNNLNVLCGIFDLTHGAISAMIGRGNLFRRDIGRPGEGTLLKICQKFDVTEEWLSTSREEAKKYIATLPKRQENKVAEVFSPYSVTEKCQFKNRAVALKLKEDLACIEQEDPDAYAWLGEKIQDQATLLRYKKRSNDT